MRETESRDFSLDDVNAYLIIGGRIAYFPTHHRESSKIRMSIQDVGFGANASSEIRGAAADMREEGYVYEFDFEGDASALEKGDLIRVTKFSVEVDGERADGQFIDKINPEDRETIARYVQI